MKTEKNYIAPSLKTVIITAGNHLANGSYRPDYLLDIDDVDENDETIILN